MTRPMPSLRSLVTNRSYKVEFLLNGEVRVTPDHGLLGVIDHAMCSEIRSHLEDALEGSYLGGYDFAEEHPESRLINRVARPAPRRPEQPGGRA